MFAKNIYFDSLICRSRVRQPLLLAPHLKILRCTHKSSWKSIDPKKTEIYFFNP